jgi:hypothetical protein
MTGTEQWIMQARQYLKAERRGGRSALSQTLQDHLTRIDLEQVQRDLGCGEQCAACSWGFLGDHALPSEPCRLLVVQEAIAELQNRSGRGAVVSGDAAALLELLDGLPSPRET